MGLPPLLSAGDVLKAEHWNTLLREVKKLSTPNTKGGSTTMSSLDESAVKILIKNTSGADRKKYEILGIDGQLYTDSPIQDQLRILDGAEPTTADHIGKFVILCNELIEDAIGYAYISGVCIVQVNMTVDTHAFADVKDADCTMLESAESGSAQILWVEAGTGTKWAIVRFPFGGGGGASIQVVQVTGTPADGQVNVKNINLKSDPSLSPNYEQSGDAYSATYYKD